MPQAAVFQIDLAAKLLPDRVLKKLFSLPLADARGSVTPAESEPAFPDRDRKGVARSVFQQPAKDNRLGLCGLTARYSPAYQSYPSFAQ
jgi:hypothetical protein